MRSRLAALLTAVTLVTLAGLSCSDSDDGGASPTRTAPPGPAVTTTAPTTGVPATQAPTTVSGACPINPVACTFATRLRGLLVGGDVAAIVAANRTQSFSCPGGAPMGPGGPFPLCSGAPAGEARTGIQTARRYSEGFVVSPQQYETILRALLQAVDQGASDPNGGGALDLYALSCLDPAAAPQACTRFAIVFSAIFRSTPVPPISTISGRELLLFQAEVATGSNTPQIVSTWTGIIMANEAPVLFRDGGILFDQGRVFVFRGR